MDPNEDEFEESDDLSEEAEDAAPAIVEGRTIVADRGQELLRIDRFLMNRVEGATRNKVQQALESGDILVNDEPAKASYKVRPGDRIFLRETRTVEETAILPQPVDFRIIHEDEHVLVLDKPAGIVVHPGTGNPHGTLVNGLLYHYDKTGGPQTLARMGLVHRIDKDTSGLLVVGKTEAALAHLSRQFKKHTVHRRYIALAWGDIHDEAGTIDLPVGRHPRFRKIMDVYADGGGKEAVTHYRVLKRFYYVTLLELRLETGRTHQIRVHLQHIGHPLFGDASYGGDRIVKGTVYAKYRTFVESSLTMLNRQALHAAELGFVHPGSGEEVRFTSPLPDDFTGILSRWERYTAAYAGRIP